MRTPVYFSREITPEKVLELYKLAGKDLSGKVSGAGRDYVRLAVRNHEDNMKLVAALKEILG